LRYSDLLAKNRNFFTTFSFSALVWGDALRIYGKILRLLKLESSRQPLLKNGGQTDGRTDRIAMAKTR